MHAASMLWTACLDSHAGISRAASLGVVCGLLIGPNIRDSNQIMPALEAEAGWPDLETRNMHAPDDRTIGTLAGMQQPCRRLAPMLHCSHPLQKPSSIL